MHFPKPNLSSDEAVNKALALFNERPEASHRAPNIITVLQEAYGLPGGELPLRIPTGFGEGIALDGLRYSFGCIHGAGFNRAQSSGASDGS